MHDVFISYAREDRGLAKKLADVLLAARGWSVWWDTSLRTGEQFPQRIQEAVAASRAVAVLWSRHSVDSNWVVAEASEGWERQILVPVLLDDSVPPMPFRQTQARDLSQWRGRAGDATLLALIEDIQRIHAQSGVVGTEELATREHRRHAFQRRKILRRGATVGAVLLLAVGAALSWRQSEINRQRSAGADELARASEALRGQVLTLTPEQDQKIWWTNLYEDPARADALELSVLLAIEARRRSPTERAERALSEALVILPGADREVAIEGADVPAILVFNHDGRLVAAGGGVGGTLVWDLDGNRVIARVAHGGTGDSDTWQDKRGRFHGGRASRQVIDFSPARDVIATAGPDSTVRVWDARTGRELLKLSLAEIATAVAFDGTGKRLATSDESGAVCLWDAMSGQQQQCMAQGSPVYWVGFSPSSALITGVAMDGSIQIWDSATGQRQHRFQHDKEVEAARFHPNGKLLASFGSDTETVVWNLESAEPWALGPDSGTYAGVVFDAATDTLIVPGADALTWWDLKTRTQRFPIASGGFLLEVAGSSDKRRLVTIDGFGEARAWNLDDGRLLKRLPYYRTHALAISPDGESMAVAGNDGEREVLDLTRIVPEDPVAAACARLSRNLTREEWHQYLGNEPYRPTCLNLKLEEEH